MLHARPWVGVGFYRISLNNASHQFNSTVKLPMEVKLMPRSHFFLQDGKLKQNGTFRAFFFSAPKVVVFFCHRPRGSFHQVGLAIETVAEQERLLGQRMNGQHRLLQCCSVPLEGAKGSAAPELPSRACPWAIGFRYSCWEQSKGERKEKEELALPCLQSQSV